MESSASRRRRSSAPGMERSGNKQAGPGKIVGKRQKQWNSSWTFRLNLFENRGKRQLLASNPSSCFAGKRFRSFAALSFSTSLAVCGERHSQVARLQIAARRRCRTAAAPDSVPSTRGRVGQPRIFPAKWKANRNERACPGSSLFAYGSHFPERRVFPRPRLPSFSCDLECGVIVTEGETGI